MTTRKASVKGVLVQPMETKTIELKPDEYVVLHVDFDRTTVEQAFQEFKKLRDQFGEGKVLALPFPGFDANTFTTEELNAMKQTIEEVIQMREGSK